MSSPSASDDTIHEEMDFEPDEPDLQSEPEPTEADTPAPAKTGLDATIALMQRHINNEFEKLNAGTGTLTKETLQLIDKLYGALDRQAAAKKKDSRKPRARGRPSDADFSAGSRSDGRPNSSGGSSAQTRRPTCTYPGCRKPVGHTVDRCFQRQRDEQAQHGGGGGAGGERGGRNTGGTKRPKKVATRDE